MIRITKIYESNKAKSRDLSKDINPTHFYTFMLELVSWLQPEKIPVKVFPFNRYPKK